jgi:quercetin dioxygenase-like cupin family protein
MKKIVSLIMVIICLMVLPVFAQSKSKTPAKTTTQAKPAVTSEKPKTPEKEYGKDKIAEIVAIKGNLDVSRDDQKTWSEAQLRSAGYIYDFFKTNSTSVADLEFTIGGHVGINKNTVIEIVGIRDVKDVSKRTFLDKVKINTGAIWAKFQGQDKSVKFETKSGVLAIKGTEFVIDEDPDKKETTVSVLEGNVTYTTAQKEIEAKAGDKITIAWEQVPVVHQYKPEELRQECENNYKELYQNIKNILNFVSMAQSFSGTSFVGSDTLYYASLAAEVINNPAEAAKNYAISQASNYIPGASILGDLINTSPSNEEKKKPDFPINLNPNQTDIDNKSPVITWDKYEGAQSYLILVSPQEDMKDLYYAEEVNENMVQYPAWAKPLQNGIKYYWRVIAVSDNKPISKASQTFFTVK